MYKCREQTVLSRSPHLRCKARAHTQAVQQHHVHSMYQRCLWAQLVSSVLQSAKLCQNMVYVALWPSQLHP